MSIEAERIQDEFKKAFAKKDKFIFFYPFYSSNSTLLAGLWKMLAVCAL